MVQAALNPLLETVFMEHMPAAQNFTWLDFS